jgi:hypothetical protein
MATLSTPVQALLGALIANKNTLLFNVITEELQQTAITDEGYLLAEVCFNRYTAVMQAQENREYLSLISNGQIN